MYFVGKEQEKKKKIQWLCLNSPASFLYGDRQVIDPPHGQSCCLIQKMGKT